MFLATFTIFKTRKVAQNIWNTLYSQYFYLQVNLYSLKKRNAEKCQNFRNWTTFRGCPLTVNLLVQDTPMWHESNKKIQVFLKFWNKELRYFFINLNSTWKMCSFELHHVKLAQKQRNLEGGHKLGLYRMTAPSIFFWITLTWITSKEHIFHVDRPMQNSEFINLQFITMAQ